jgi:hypothetical protein
VAPRRTVVSAHRVYWSVLRSSSAWRPMTSSWSGRRDRDALGEQSDIDDLAWFALRWDVLAQGGALRVQDPPTEWQRVGFPNGFVFGEAEVSEFVR